MEKEKEKLEKKKFLIPESEFLASLGIEDLVQGKYTFHLGDDDLTIQVSRLGFGDSQIKRGFLSDGDRTLHYELDEDKLIRIVFDNDVEGKKKNIEWESILSKGAYQFKMVGDRLGKGIINHLKLSEQSVS
jgi:hypothetical protein